MATPLEKLAQHHLKTAGCHGMLASGGYPWLVVPIEKRNAYMQALEEASVRQNILPFVNLLAGLLNNAKKPKFSKA